MTCEYPVFWWIPIGSSSINSYHTYNSKKFWLYIHYIYIYIYSHCIPISPKKSTIKLDVIPHQSTVLSQCFTRKTTSKISKTLCQAEERSQAEALAEIFTASDPIFWWKTLENPWAVGMYIWIWQYCWLMSRLMVFRVMFWFFLGCKNVPLCLSDVFFSMCCFVGRFVLITDWDMDLQIGQGWRVNHGTPTRKHVLSRWCINWPTNLNSYHNRLTYLFYPGTEGTVNPAN